VNRRAYEVKAGLSWWEPRRCYRKTKVVDGKQQVFYLAKGIGTRSPETCRLALEEWEKKEAELEFSRRNSTCTLTAARSRTVP